MIKGSLIAAVASAAVFAAAPAQAATTFEDVLGATGANAYRFSFAGGNLQIDVLNSGANGIGDPMAWVFVDDGSPNNALTGTFVGMDDDAGDGLNARLFFNGLAAGNYVLSVGQFSFNEGEARSTNAGGAGAGTTFTVGFNQTVGLGAVPEPSTWAMLILGFGAVGAGMRRRTTRVAFA